MRASFVVWACAVCACAPAAVDVCNDDDDCAGVRPAIAVSVCLEGRCVDVDVDVDVDVGDGEGEGKGEGEGEEGEGEGEGDAACAQLPPLIVTLTLPGFLAAGDPARFEVVVDNGVGVVDVEVGVDDDSVAVLDGDEVVALYGAVGVGIDVTVSASDGCGRVGGDSVHADVVPPRDCSALENGAAGRHPTGTYTLRPADGDDVDVFCLFPDTDPLLDGYGLAVVAGAADNTLVFSSPFWTDDRLFGGLPTLSGGSSGKFAPAILAGKDIAYGARDAGGPIRWAHTLIDGGLGDRPVDIIRLGSIDNSLGRATWRRLHPTLPDPCATFDNRISQPGLVRFGATCAAATDSGTVVGIGGAGASVVGAAAAFLASRSPDFRGVPLERDCRAHRDHGRSVSGRYAIDVGEVEAVDVHCEMDVDGGGWTLIGRSDSDLVDAAFGWDRAGGAVADFGRAYSLGQRIPFTQLLIADRGTGVTAEDVAVVVDVDGDALFADGRAPVTAMVTLLGACALDLRTLVFVADRFHFDVDANVGNRDVGLSYDGLSLPGCDGDGDQGLIFAR